MCEHVAVPPSLKSRSIKNLGWGLPELGIAMGLVALVWGLLVPSPGGIAFGVIGTVVGVVARVRRRRHPVVLGSEAPASVPLLAALAAAPKSPGDAWPQVQLTRPRSQLRWLALRIAVPLGVVVTAMVVGGLVAHNSAMVTGSLIAIVVIAVILGIEIGLVVLMQRRAAEDRISRAPVGTLYAAPGWLQEIAGSAGTSSVRVRGVLELTSQGLRLGPPEPNRRGVVVTDEVALDWTQLTSVVAAPGRNAAYELRVTTLSGTSLTWTAFQPTRLFDVLVGLERQP
ncbi:MAG: hypothetical protein JWP74_649 [Marmoricola sp.]|nr:hypothetical protein [Marmoricola sp.]